MKVKLILVKLSFVFILLFTLNINAQDCAFQFLGGNNSTEFQCNDNLALPALSGGLIFSGLLDANNMPITSAAGAIVWNIDPLTTLPTMVHLIILQHLLIILILVLWNQVAELLKLVMIV